jgi:hypothetical protein
MSDFYILKDKVPVLTNRETWNTFIKEPPQIGNDTIGDVGVSTIFIGMTLKPSDGAPLLFETMIYGGEFDREEEWYSTYEKAEAGHALWVAIVKGER